MAVLSVAVEQDLSRGGREVMGALHAVRECLRRLFRCAAMAVVGMLFVSVMRRSPSWGPSALASTGSRHFVRCRAWPLCCCIGATAGLGRTMCGRSRSMAQRRLGAFWTRYEGDYPLPVPPLCSRAGDELVRIQRCGSRRLRVACGRDPPVGGGIARAARKEGVRSERMPTALSLSRFPLPVWRIRGIHRTASPSISLRVARCCNRRCRGQELWRRPVPPPPPSSARSARFTGVVTRWARGDVSKQRSRSAAVWPGYAYPHSWRGWDMSYL